MGLAARVLRAQIEAVLEKRIPGALTVRPAMEREIIPFGIPELDRQALGILRGCVTEICGPSSSGRTTLVVAALREMTQRGECCALVDASSSFDPHSASANDVNLKNVLVVRCAEPHPKLTPVDKALKAVSWIVHDGGFGLVILDMGDVRVDLARKIPLSHWYGFRRAVESTNACLVVVEQHPFVKSCAAQVFTMHSCEADWKKVRNQFLGPKLLTGIRFRAEVCQSRVALGQRKRLGTADTEFRVATAWAG